LVKNVILIDMLKFFLYFPNIENLGFSCRL
jgi:hypothetical protein